MFSEILTLNAKLNSTEMAVIWDVKWKLCNLSFPSECGIIKGARRYGGTAISRSRNGDAEIAGLDIAGLDIRDWT